MKQRWRRLDNTAKVFSLEGRRNANTFRLSVVLKENIDVNILRNAIVKTLERYPSYRVKIKSGLFWNYLEFNCKDPIIEEESGIPCENINFRRNNGYLFKITYYKNKLNLDIFHVLTDGVGANIFLKDILSNYLDLKYKLPTNNENLFNKSIYNQDYYLKYADRKLKLKNKKKNAYLIKEKSDLSINKTYHYIVDLTRFKSICKKYKVSITEYLTAIYIYAIYKSIYNQKTKKDIAITIPIDLRKRYQVESFSNFFTCMKIEGNVNNSDNITFSKILRQVHKEFKFKLTNDNIKKYLANDVKLGNNIFIRLVPLFGKKIFMNYFERLVNQEATTTLSNIGPIKVDEKYKEYIDNIFVLVNAGILQKVKCTICSYENNLTITINSNIIKDDFENEFHRLLKKYIGKIKLESNII